MTRNRPVTNDATFRRVHRNTRRRNNETQVLHRVCMEGALLRFGMEVVLVETIQNVPHVNLMLLNRIRKNKNIIKIDDDTNVSHIGKDIIHKMLEGGRSVSQTKGHNQVFECAVVGPKSSEPFVALGNVDIIVPCAEIDLGKYFGQS